MTRETSADEEENIEQVPQTKTNVEEYHHLARDAVHSCTSIEQQPAIMSTDVIYIENHVKR
jgi:hypothetical protein